MGRKKIPKNSFAKISVQLSDAVIYKISGNIEAGPLVTLVPEEEEITVKRGKTHTVSVSVVPENMYDSEELVYSSSDTKIVSVDENGILTGVSPGNAKITVKTDDGLYSVDIPVTVKDVYEAYWNESFEGDLSAWTVRDKSSSGFSDTAPYSYITLNDGIKYDGYGSLAINKTGKQVLIRKTFEEDFNKVLSVWFYDDVSYTENRVMACMERSANNRVSLGVRKNTSSEYYTLWIDTNKYSATDVKRSTGWHNFVFDATSGTSTVAYIDGKKVGESTGNTYFNQITLGWWQAGAATSVAFDNVSIFDSLSDIPYFELGADLTYDGTDEGQSCKLTVLGAQIRVKESETEEAEIGFRFVNRIGNGIVTKFKELSDLNKEPSDPDDTGIGYGFVVQPSDSLGECLLKKTTEGVLIVPAVNMFYACDDYLQYTVCITDIPVSDYDRKYTVRPYITYLNESGDEVTVYGNQYSASLLDVAKLAVSENDEKKDIFQKYIIDACSSL